MVEIGKYNKLKVLKKVEFGLYLDGEEKGEILLPKKYADASVEVGHEVEVFIYNDSEDRIIATTEKPYAIVGEFAYLKLKAINNTGAFFEWGLLKDLLVPYSEQKQKMTEGFSYLLYVYFDTMSKRIVASARLDKFLDNVPAEYEIGQEISALVASETDIGYKAIINNLHWGLIYKSELNRPLRTGQVIAAFISNIRDDEKIDLTLFKPNIEKIDDIAVSVLDQLAKNNGFLPFTDKSDAEEIYKWFKISKKTFKKTLGNLYRRRLIALEPDGIRIISKK